MTKKGVRVAQAGTDALTDSPDDLAFSSEFISPKIHEATANSVTLAGGTVATITVHHNLGFSPMHRVFVETVPGSGKWYGDANIPDGNDPSTAAEFLAYTDDRNLTILIIGTLGLTYQYKYWLFEDLLT